MNATSKDGQILNTMYAKQIWGMLKLPFIISFIMSMGCFFIFEQFKFFSLYFGVDFKTSSSIAMLFPLLTTILLGGLFFFKTNNQSDENSLRIKYILIKTLGILSIFSGYMIWLIIATIEINRFSNLDNQIVSQVVSKSYFLYFPLIVGTLGFVLCLNQQTMPIGLDSGSFSLNKKIVSSNATSDAASNAASDAASDAASNAASNAASDAASDAASLKIITCEMITPDENKQRGEKVVKITLSGNATEDLFIDKFGSPTWQFYIPGNEVENVNMNYRLENRNGNEIFIYIEIPNEYHPDYYKLIVLFNQIPYPLNL